MSDFDLGDFIETLPYEGGPGSPDEFIANNLLSKRLNLRNEELKEDIVALGETYLPSTGEGHYINISSKENYEYSPAIKELEKKLKSLRDLIAAKKEMEKSAGIAVPISTTIIVSVNKMSDEILRRIKLNKSLKEADDDL